VPSGDASRAPSALVDSPALIPAGANAVFQGATIDPILNSRAALERHSFGHRNLGRLAKGRGTGDSVLRPVKADPLSGMAIHKEACVVLKSV
jgi:hypothetical protein